MQNVDDVHNTSQPHLIYWKWNAVASINVLWRQPTWSIHLRHTKRCLSSAMNSQGRKYKIFEWLMDGFIHYLIIYSFILSSSLFPDAVSSCMIFVTFSPTFYKRVDFLDLIIQVHDVSEAGPNNWNIADRKLFGFCILQEAGTIQWCQWSSSCWMHYRTLIWILHLTKGRNNSMTTQAFTSIFKLYWILGVFKMGSTNEKKEEEVKPVKGAVVLQ